MRPIAFSLTSLSLLAAFPACLPLTAGEIPPDSIRAAVKRSLPYIQVEGQRWIEEQDCLSCHRVSNMLWALEAAKLAGFETNEELDEVKQWAIDSSQALDDSGAVAATKNKEGIAQLLLADGQRAMISENDRAEFLRLMIDSQDADGSWAPDGQLPSQKRPKYETRAVSTAWIALALGQSQEQNITSDALQRAILSLARTFADAPSGEHRQPVSTEWFAVRLLLAKQQGESELIDQLRTSLLQHQQADGGWGWLIQDPSDALGTGFALYALENSGELTPEIRNRAVSYLVRIQSENGAWPTNGTKANKQDKVQETATYWATTWAVLALLASLRESAAVTS